MVTRIADTSFQFPDLIAAPARPGWRHAEPGPQRTNNGLGALRGLAFAVIFEAVAVLAGFSCWELWRLLR